MKKCNKCGQLKSSDSFHKDSSKPDSRSTVCKLCKLAQNKDYAATTTGKQSHAMAKKKWFATNSGKTTRANSNRRHRDKHKLAVVARDKLNGALRAGRVTRQPCEVCGSEFTEAHHRDYSKPLDVKWLCRRHHLSEHGKAPVWDG